MKSLRRIVAELDALQAEVGAKDTKRNINHGPGFATLCRGKWARMNTDKSRKHPASLRATQDSPGGSEVRDQKAESKKRKRTHRVDYHDTRKRRKSFDANPEGIRGGLGRGRNAQWWKLGNSRIGSPFLFHEGILALATGFGKMSRKMKLPNVERAVVPGRKITHYLLSNLHRDGQHKAEFFRSFGFKLEAWEELATALLDHARNYEVVETVPTPFGRNFVIEGALSTPDGRAPQVRAIWFIANGRESATLATAYPFEA